MATPSRLLLTGRVGAEPEVKTTQSGKKMARVRLATTYKDFDETTQSVVDKTQWHTVVFWEELANLAERHIHKGVKIFVEGYPQKREYFDSLGEKRTAEQINAVGFSIK